MGFDAGGDVEISVDLRWYIKTGEVEYKPFDLHMITRDEKPVIMMRLSHGNSPPYIQSYVFSIKRFLFVAGIVYIQSKGKLEIIFHKYKENGLTLDMITKSLLKRNRSDTDKVVWDIIKKEEILTYLGEK